MKILYTITYFTPHNSGLTRGLEVIAHHFACKHAVDVLAARHEPTLELHESISHLAVTRVPVAVRLRKGLVMPLHAWRSWQRLADCDLVHIIAPQMDAGPTALLAFLRRRPVIMSYVCSFSSPGIVGAIATFALRVSHVLAGLVASDIVVLSADYAEQSRFCRLFRRKLRFIDVPIPNFPSRVEPYRPAEAPYRIGFVGRISKEKNIDLLIDAIPHLRKVLNAVFTVELVGPDEPAGAVNASRLRDRIASCRDDELIRRGSLTESELVEFYREIDVLVLPSVERIEAYGMVQVEAMLRGTPCVTSDLPGMRQPIVRTGFGRLFKAGDSVALAEALRQVLEDGPARQPAPHELSDLFDNDRVFDALNELYHNTLSSHEAN